jgi:hypothetical protein
LIYQEQDRNLLFVLIRVYNYVFFFIVIQNKPDEMKLVESDCRGWLSNGRLELVMI